MKEIQLGGKRGGVALVDDEDFERINQYSWCNHNGYAVTTINEKTIRMHCMVMNHKQNRKTIVHHKDNDTLNNQKYNLEILAQEKHVWTYRSHRDGKSKYKGVSCVKNNKNWQMQITNGKIKIHEYYTKEEDAAHAYDYYALKYYGSLAYLNFPEFDYANYVPIPLKPEKTSKYKYIGISKNKWQIQVRVNGKMKHFGYFETELEAITHYNNVVAPLLGKPTQEILVS